MNIQNLLERSLIRYYARIIKQFFELKATKKVYLAHLLISAILRTTSEFLIPFAAAMVIEAATGGDYTQALVNAALFLGSGLLYVVCHHYNYWAYYKNANYIHDELQRRILDKVTQFDPGFAQDLSHATIVNTAFADVTECQRVPDFFFDFLTEIAGVLISTGILFALDRRIGLITLVLALFSLFLFTYHMRRRNHHNHIQLKYQDDISGLYSQILDGYKEVHTMDIEDQLKAELDADKKNWGKHYGRQRIHRDLADSTVPFIIGVGRLIIYLIAAGLILNGQFSIATLVLIIGYYETVQSNYDLATETIYQLSRCAVSISRVHTLLHYKTPNMLKFGENRTDDITGVVEFKNVSFKYNDKSGRGSLKNVSFSAAPGAMTAIVGKSGSGKSTIFRLLLRLYQVDRGQILLDGKDINDYTREVYASNVSMVTQKPFVFDMTIRENLSLVDSNREHQIAACKAAGIHAEIMKLPKGYDTPLIADADNLSAGQKQLLALARTLLSRSEVLLFDEVTSALDPATSAKIVSVLKKLKKTHTVIMITHKPDLMRMADNIIVIKSGRVAGAGRHRELLTSCPEYRELQR